YFTGDVVGCSLHEGLVLTSIPYLYLGQSKSGAPGRNWIGTDSGGHDLGNVEWGVLICCDCGAYGNQVVDNVIANNGWDGLELSGIVGSVVFGNELARNGGAGVRAEDSSRGVLNEN